MKIWEQMQKTAPSKKIEAKSLDQKNKMLQEENINLRSEAHRAKAESSIKTAEADSLKNQLKFAQLEIEKLKASNNKMRDICAYFEKQLQEKDNTFSVIISEFKKTHERLKHDLKLAQEKYADDKTKLNKMLEVANAENKNLKNKIGENNASIQAMCSQLNAIKQEKASEMQQREQNYKKAIQKLDSEKKYAEEQIKIKNNQLQNQKNLLFQEKKDMAWEITKLNKIIKERTIAIDKTKNLYNQKNQKLQFYSSEKIKELESSLNDLRKELNFKKHKENLSNQKLATLNRQLNENEKFINEFSENFKKQELLLQKLKEEKVRVMNKSSVKISTVKTPSPPQPKPPQPKPPQPKPAETKPAETKPAETKPAETNNNLVGLPSDFDVKAYRELNEDLLASKLTDLELKQHYLKNAKNEGRRYKKFNAKAKPDPHFTDQNKIKLYQIYYDKKHADRIINHAIPYFNANPTIYFESGVMRDIFNQKNYNDCEYIGVLSWKASQKIINMKTLSQIDAKISSQKYDIYTFNNKNFLGYTKPHRGSHQDYDNKAWAALMKLVKNMQLKKIWPQVSERKLDQKMLRIYCNYFIARKEIWEDFVGNFVIPAIQEMEKDEYINSVATCPHKSYPRKLPRSFIDSTGFDYYPMAPFMLERLINVYVVMRNVKVGFIL